MHFQDESSAQRPRGLGINYQPIQPSQTDQSRLQLWI